MLRLKHKYTRKFNIKQQKNSHDLQRPPHEYGGLDRRGSHGCQLIIRWINSTVDISYAINTKPNKLHHTTIRSVISYKTNKW